MHAPQCYIIQGDQKVSVRLTITVHGTGAQRLFDHPVHTLPVLFVCNNDCSILNLSINLCTTYFKTEISTCCTHRVFVCSL